MHRVIPLTLLAVALLTACVAPSPVQPAAAPADAAGAQTVTVYKSPT